ncbi:crotonobetainyl-CoA:carnitine CoA-transferase CaiB-like acyl-CoA transferase [Paraburkholderia sp. BL23I1N1]|uniref:CaiB/BaiF CoA transferase family protein n=1 Tax=Paraburkholderia sp. BL23I1N1 TaxID=1938802 RepID=UPI000E73CE4C|nr:CoA transferase [Paraburkholderia sp. BL23I1N1]RKE25778.1 crotonobetainyl-CoA:carnitine CoA-transferase CaiB-like acyl-CoA transferase [Paraburkholderia sp. BL23I1N1]
MTTSRAPSTSNTAFAPLAGVKVLDFSHVIAGPFATFLLAQLGADVIKVESADGGDVMRRTGRGRQSFVALNAGKRTTVLDLATNEGREQAMLLAAECDVLVDNLRPGVLEKHGLGFDAVHAAYPRLLYCSISGFGRGAQAWRHRPAYDHVIQAATGMAWMAGNEGDLPIKTGFPAVDSATGLLAAFAILAGLREIEQTGTGLLLDVSMAGASLQLMYPMACAALTSGETPPRVGNQGYSNSPAADFFRTRDGWLALGANTPRQLLALLDELGLGSLATDPAFFAVPLSSDAPPAFARSVDPERLKKALADVLCNCDAAEMERRLNERQVPAARLRTLGEFADEVRENHCVDVTTLSEDDVTVRSPGLGFTVYRPH